jgi:hypothetical protein
MKLNYQNEQATPSTPLMTSDRFKNCIPEDLFKRLEESSPVKSRMSGPHKMSDFGIISCKDAEDEITQNEEGDKEPKEQMLNLQNFSKTKNFKLKAQLMNKNEEYDEDLFRNDSFPQFNNSTPFSPLGMDKFKALKRDSSPLYNYYDGTTEYLSQSFLNEYGKNEDHSNQFNYLRKNDNPDYISYNDMYNSGHNANYMENYPQFNQQRNFSVPNEYHNFNPEPGYIDNSYSDINNSGKKSSNGDSSSNMKEDGYIVEMFGKRGWICDSCNNFNYESIYY